MNEEFEYANTEEIQEESLVNFMCSLGYEPLYDSQTLRLLRFKQPRFRCIGEEYIGLNRAIKLHNTAPESAWSYITTVNMDFTSFLDTDHGEDIINLVAAGIRAVVVGHLCAGGQPGPVGFDRLRHGHAGQPDPAACAAGDGHRHRRHHRLSHAATGGPVRHRRTDRPAQPHLAGASLPQHAGRHPCARRIAVDLPAQPGPFQAHQRRDRPPGRRPRATPRGRRAAGAIGGRRLPGPAGWRGIRPADAAADRPRLGATGQHAPDRDIAAVPGRSRCRSAQGDLQRRHRRLAAGRRGPLAIVAPRRRPPAPGQAGRPQPRARTGHLTAALAGTGGHDYPAGSRARPHGRGRVVWKVWQGSASACSDWRC